MAEKPIHEKPAHAIKSLDQDIKSIQKKLIHWYRDHQRRLPWRDNPDPYRIWVSEVMLQQTQMKTVLPYYRKFVLQFPDVSRLASADLQTVLKAWEGLGYYARARNLHRTAKIILAQHRGKVPDNWTAIRKLPGVGDYIAAAVLSIAFNQPCAVVDGNVKRVLARLYQVEAPINKSSSYKIFKKISERILDRHNPGRFNQALMELGALICKPSNPACEICPIQVLCAAHQSQSVSEYPKRMPNAPIPLRHIVVGVIYKNNHILITRRKPNGLLGGLWEFPGGKIAENEAPDSACVREIREEVGLKIKIDRMITTVKHAYTHFKISMHVFSCRYISGEVELNGPIDYRWITLSEIDRYPFPGANQKFIPLLKTKGQLYDNSQI